MPRRDGTGPIGTGQMTGYGFRAMKKSFGNVGGKRCGLGLRCRRGFKGNYGRGYATFENDLKSRKELLKEEKEILEKKLNLIDEELRNL